MSEFETYLWLGYGHIIDLGAYDHLLFVITLCAVYAVSQWRRILVLVTAFTLGHSLTLALATRGIILVAPDIVEFLIPVTILATALLNVFEKVEHIGNRTMRWNYTLALFFGFIHGMGFSSYLSMLIGEEESILLPLFAFNIGLEIGQLLIVMFTMATAYLAINIFRVQHREWNLFISGVATGISLLLISNARFW